jgi:hypothetical protein
MTVNKKRSPHRPSLASIVRQATKAGVEIARIEFEGGKITIVTSRGDSAEVTANNPWDEVLTGNGRRDGP